MFSPIPDNIEQILDRFDEAWNGPTPPRIEDFLLPTGSPGHLPMLVELLKIDMERRLKRGEQVRLEQTYLPRFPELDGDPASLLELVVYQYQLLQQKTMISIEEYLGSVDVRGHCRTSC
jgi:hypothetical protein